MYPHAEQEFARVRIRVLPDVTASAVVLLSDGAERLRNRETDDLERPQLHMIVKSRFVRAESCLARENTGAGELGDLIRKDFRKLGQRFGKCSGSGGSIHDESH
jgi:hypothetical protein